MRALGRGRSEDKGEEGRGDEGLLALAVLLLVAGCLLQIFAGYSHPDLSGHAWGSDDAYISYRYAQHLASGQGLVFNPGERVEGFSNLLYVLLLAPAAALVPPARLYAVSAGLNLLFAAAALVLLYRFTRRRLGSFAAAIVAGLFALGPSVWVAVASGLETPMVLLLQIGTWILVEQAVEEGGARERRAVAGLCLVAAVLVLARVDGFIAPMLAAAFLTLRGRWRSAFAVAGSALATFGALTLWRLAYYGWPLPNTYYAKMTSTLGMRLEAGGEQLLTILLGTGLVIALAGFVIAGVRSWKVLPFPVLFAAGSLGYYLYIGGDLFYDRFVVVLFPMGAWLLLALALQSGSRRAVAALAVLLAAAQLVPLGTDPRFHYRLHKYDRWVTLGQFLGREQRGAVLAVDGAGKVPYFSNLRTIDMLGLADVHIAHRQADARGYFWAGHAKSDLPYVLSRRPDLIATWLGNRFALRQGPVAEPEVLASAGYRLLYLTNIDPESKGRDVLDVRRTSSDEIRRLFGNGYRYGVFERVRVNEAGPR
ncbi:MAG: hypothetical protein JF614_10110 [Acidobacteria bacterium]|nr:hypothetical protein [Acidobacteriota bacterium]